VDEILVYLTSFMTLYPGDLVLTGFPAECRHPGPGDTVTCRVGKGSESWSNPVTPRWLTATALPAGRGSGTLPTAAVTAAAAASRSASVTDESKLNLTAVWATSASMPSATSTGDGASDPAAQAEPLEQTTPWRSSSRSTDSPLVPGKQNEATEGSRSTGCPVSTAPGMPVSTALMNVSRRPVTGPSSAGLVGVRQGEGGGQAHGTRHILGA
jgi:hypothetical protein